VLKKNQETKFFKMLHLPELDTNDAILVQNKLLTKIVKELFEQLAKIP